MGQLLTDPQARDQLADAIVDLYEHPDKLTQAAQDFAAQPAHEIASDLFALGGEAAIGVGAAAKLTKLKGANKLPEADSTPGKDNLAGGFHDQAAANIIVDEALNKLDGVDVEPKSLVGDGGVGSNSQLTKQEALQRMQEALRYRQLSWNHEQKKFSIIEAHGVSRAEQALGRRFEPSNIEGVDFLDPTGLGKISLKGPFLDNNLQPLKLEYQQKAAENILKHVEANKAVDIHIIDTKGLNDKVFKAMQETLKNSQTKIQYLR